MRIIRFSFLTICLLALPLCGACAIHAGEAPSLVELYPAAPEEPRAVEIGALEEVEAEKEAEQAAEDEPKTDHVPKTDHIPMIAGKEAFCYKDIVELRQNLGYTLGDYSTDNSLIDSIEITDDSVAGPRGIKVGDPYRKVVANFPVEDKPRLLPGYEIDPEWDILYRLNYAQLWNYWDGYWGGSIIYDYDGLVIAVNYSYTFPLELPAAEEADYSIYGYNLRFAIGNELVEGIYLTMFIQYAPSEDDAPLGINS